MENRQAVRYDLDAWVRARVGITNVDGGRGYENGVRTVACPLHGDSGAHGWLNIERGWAGCFSPECDASAGLPAVEYVRRVEGLRTRASAVAFLLAEFPGVGPPPPPKPVARYDDWCETVGMPLIAVPPISRGASRLEPILFCGAQWGLNVGVVDQMGLRYCIFGRYVWRIIIPIVMGGQGVAFQARSYRGGEPKYLTSKWGKRGDLGAECGRPAEALLFNLDAVQERSDVVIVEGAGDAMRWDSKGEICGGAAQSGQASDGKGRAADKNATVAVALLGTALTGEKAALLAAKKPRRVIVALDAEPETAGAQRDAVETLWAMGLDAVEGRWVGAKDAGAGARLELVACAPGLVGAVARRLGR